MTFIYKLGVRLMLSNNRGSGVAAILKINDKSAKLRLDRLKIKQGLLKETSKRVVSQ